MSCYQSASAVVERGTAGYLLVITVKVYAGIIPPALEKGNSPFNPENVYPVTVKRSVPHSSTEVELQVTQNLSRPDEFDYVEIFCENITPGTRVPVFKGA